MDTKMYPLRTLSRSTSWQEGTKATIKSILKDPIISRLLLRSNVTQAQFETLLVDQLGHDMANKQLTRSEMAQLMRNAKGISRGALNRTLRQARENVSEAIHTILLLGYGGIIESPSLAPFVEASDLLKSQMTQFAELARDDPRLYRERIDTIVGDLEEAFLALFGKHVTRDVT
ncbi:hypothetical protein AUI06_12910 [archaeon 13_2_20CM_2_52_21]|nr:MAG: hypothetical protein AUI06_12910 [archaeon 13_2_20CM_2_52_21]